MQLAENSDEPIAPLRLDFVRVWILAARDGGTRVVLNGG